MPSQKRIVALIEELEQSAEGCEDGDTAELMYEAVGLLKAWLEGATVAFDVVDTEPDSPLVGDMTTLRDLGFQMATIGTRLAEVKELKTNLQLDYDRLRLEKVPTIMQSLGVANAKFTGLGRIQLANDLRASTRKGKKDDALAWLRDCGQDDMIKETVHSSTLKAYLKRLLVDGAEIPGEIFNVTPFTRASIVKA